MNNIIKGTIYEHEICEYLNKNIGIAWVWRNIPEDVLLESGLIHNQNEHRIKKLRNKDDPESYANTLIEIGIDILLKVDNKYNLVQCKCGYKNGLTIGNLGGFSYMLLNHPDKDGIVYYTDKLSDNLTSNHLIPRLKFKQRASLQDNVDIQHIPVKKYTLRSYQKIAVHVFKQHYFVNNNKRGILNLPCGTGKTIISCHISRLFKHVIIISPLKQHAEQNMEKYYEYFGDFKKILIDSDGTRDINKINNYN